MAFCCVQRRWPRPLIPVFSVAFYARLLIIVWEVAPIRTHCQGTFSTTNSPSARITDAIRKIVRYRAKTQGYADHLKESSLKQMSNGDSQKSDTIFQAVNHHLSKKEAKAITYRYKDNCTIQETADQMNIKARSVSRYVSVGIKKLKTIF